MSVLLGTRFLRDRRSDKESWVSTGASMWHATVAFSRLQHREAPAIVSCAVVFWFVAAEWVRYAMPFPVRSSTWSPRSQRIRRSTTWFKAFRQVQFDNIFNFIISSVRCQTSCMHTYGRMSRPAFIRRIVFSCLTMSWEKNEEVGHVIHFNVDLIPSQWACLAA